MDKQKIGLQTFANLSSRFSEKKMSADLGFTHFKTMSPLFVYLSSLYTPTIPPDLVCFHWKIRK